MPSARASIPKNPTRFAIIISDSFSSSVEFRGDRSTRVPDLHLISEPRRIGFGDDDGIAGVKRRLLNASAANSIDESAVRRSRVYDCRPPIAKTDPRVAAGDSRIINNDLRSCGTP